MNRQGSSFFSMQTHHFVIARERARDCHRRNRGFCGVWEFCRRQRTVHHLRNQKGGSSRLVTAAITRPSGGLVGSVSSKSRPFALVGSQ